MVIHYFLYILFFFFTKKNKLDNYLQNSAFTNFPLMKNVFFSLKMNFFYLFMLSKLELDFPLRLDLSNIYDSRIINPDKPNEITTYAYYLPENINILFDKSSFIDGTNVKPSKFLGFTIISSNNFKRKNDKENKLLLYLVFYFKINDEYLKLNFRSRYIFKNKIFPDYSMTANEVRTLNDHSQGLNMTKYKINPELLKKFEDIDLDSTLSNSNGINHSQIDPEVKIMLKNRYHHLIFYSRKDSKYIQNKYSDLLKEVNVKKIDRDGEIITTFAFTFDYIKSTNIQVAGGINNKKIKFNFIDNLNLYEPKIIGLFDNKFYESYYQIHKNIYIKNKHTDTRLAYLYLSNKFFYIYQYFFSKENISFDVLK